MLNACIVEAVVLKAPRRINSKEDDTKFFSYMELGIPPFGADKNWLKRMISEGRKTGYVFARAITVSGRTTIEALKFLNRGDLISASGSLSMMSQKELDNGYTLPSTIGIRIERFEKIMSNFLKVDTSKIARAPTMIGSPGTKPRVTQNEKENNGIQENPGHYQRDTGILDDTEFNFED